MVGTVKQDVPYIEVRLREHTLRDLFGSRVGTVWTDIGDSQEERDEVVRKHFNQVAYHLLMRLIAHTLDEKDSFLFTCFDLIYADRTVRSAWHLHELTGTVISIFVGPVKQNLAGSEHYRAVAAEPKGLLRAFVNNMTPHVSIDASPQLW